MSAARGEFAIAEQPIVGEARAEEPTRAENFDDLGELPRSYDVPLLVAVARDPRTLFAYWEVDWQTVFSEKPPREPAVYLRVCADGSEESLSVVEPLAGSAYVKVANADTHYEVELGYYGSAGDWISVIASQRVLTPRDSVEQSSDFQLVTIPLHLSFQQMVDSIRGSRFDDRALADAMSELQQRFENGHEADARGAEEARVTQSLEWSLSPAEANQRAAFRSAAKQKPIGRARLERLLGFGTASPTSNGSGGGS